jgi:PiT family inorganic phosphate transporter
MNLLLLFAAAALGYANGANDNFKGVATLWGADQATYRRALVWATGFTLLGSLVAVWLGAGLAAKFSGSKLVGREIYTQLPFLAAVALAAAATVWLASRLGLPISTTHALTGALVGTGVVAAGSAQVKFAALGSGIVLPLLFSPLVALVLTLAVFPVVTRVGKVAGWRDCVCVEDAQMATAAAADGVIASVAVGAPPALRWAKSAECQTGAESVRMSIPDGLHWLSGAAISFARGLNDTPKIAAVLLVAAASRMELNHGLIAAAMAAGGLLGAARVAQTMSKKITPMTTTEAISANLVAATLVTLATPLGLPVSTTYVTSGGIFGIGLLRRGEADWNRVRQIVLSWVATLPIAALLGAAGYWLLKH